LSRDSDERLSVMESIAERMGRRGFVAKLSMGAMGLATALAGLPQAALAADGAPTVRAGCCNLCHSSTAGCTGRCCWTWACCVVGGHLQRCKECYSSASCSGGCPSKCSQQTVSPQIC